MENEKKTKQKLVIAVGALAILGVAAITIYRAENAGDSGKSASETPAANEPTYSFLTGPELKEKIRQDRVQLIDIRTVAEYGLEHIIDSINIPLDELVRSSELNFNKDIVIIGPPSEEALKSAIKTLSEKGIRNIFLLQGGFVDWKSIGERTVTWGDLSSFQDQAKVTFVSLDDFQNMMKNGASVIIIDVRKSIFYQEGHIQGALNIPLSEIEKKRGEIPSSKAVVFYADNELEAFQAAVKLYDMKLKSAGVLRGGLDAWKEKGYETVK